MRNDECPCRACDEARAFYDLHRSMLAIPARPRRRNRWLQALPWFLVLAVGSGAMWVLLPPFLDGFR